MPVPLSEFLTVWNSLDNLEVSLEVIQGKRLPSGYILHDFIERLLSHVGSFKINDRIYERNSGGLSSIYFYNLADSDITTDYMLLYSTIDDIVVLSRDRHGPTRYVVNTLDDVLTIVLMN